MARCKAFAVALLLTLTVAFSLITLPTVDAHDPPWNYETFTYLTVSPNPIGVGQDAIVVIWLSWWPPTADNYGYGGRWTFDLKITKPNNTTETRTIMSDAAGAASFVYSPDQVGNYTFVAHHPKETVTWDLGLGLRPGTTQSQYNQVYLNDTFGESTSEPFILTVQAEPIQKWVESPLPTEYWTRPVNSMSREWWPILGNWLGTSSGAQYYPTGSYGSTHNYAYGSGAFQVGFRQGDELTVAHITTPTVQAQRADTCYGQRRFGLVALLTHALNQRKASGSAESTKLLVSLL